MPRDFYCFHPTKGEQATPTVYFSFANAASFFCAQCFPLCDIHHLVVIYKKTRFAIFSQIYEVELKFMTNLRNNKEEKHTSEFWTLWFFNAFLAFFALPSIWIWRKLKLNF